MSSSSGPSFVAARRPGSSNLRAALRDAMVGMPAASAARCDVGGANGGWFGVFILSPEIGATLVAPTSSVSAYSWHDSRFGIIAAPDTELELLAFDSDGGSYKKFDRLDDAKECGE